MPVQTLAADGVFAGTLCDEGFCPDAPLDRKTMAVWIVRVLDGADPSAVASTRFADVDGTHPHAAFIERLATLGVTQGCGDGTNFCPDETVTRAQMAVFLSRAFGLPDGANPGFADIPDDAWYAADVARLAASRITAGCGDGTAFCPDRSTTRAEMATFLWRAASDEGATVSAEVSATGESMSVGIGRACAVRADHTIECWGRTRGDTPPGLFLAVSVGDDFALGLRIDKSVECWGKFILEPVYCPQGEFVSVSASTGQLASFGCGVRTDRTVTCWGPGLGAVIPGDMEFLSVSAGKYYSCGVRTDRTVTCWGHEFSPWGGRDTYLDSPDGEFLSVSVGNSHACGIRTDHTVACWGIGGDVPFDLPSGSFVPSGKFVSVSTYNKDHNCGLRADQTIVCWSIEGPKEGVPRGQFVSVSTGSDASCGLRIDHSVTCWGSQLEEPSSREFLAPEYRHGLATLSYHFSDQDPAPPSGRAAGDTLSAGYLHSCGVRADKTVACWGANYTLADPFGPTYQSVPPPGKFISLSAGDTHSCAVRIDGSVKCWGSLEPRPGSFNRVEFPPARSPEGFFTLVDAGPGYSCGLRLDQTLYCWDDGDRSPALLLTESFPYSFVSLATDSFSSVSVGDWQACGVRTDQTVTCWARSTLLAGVPSGTFLSVSAGGKHSCGMRTDQTVTCWGDDQHGQASAPSGTFLSVSAGGKHSCGMRTDQTVTCWGDNNRGLDDPDQFECPLAVMCLPERLRQQFFGPDQPGQADAPSGRFAAPGSG